MNERGAKRNGKIAKKEIEKDRVREREKKKAIERERERKYS